MMQQSKQLVPKLRFPEFEGGWEEKKLSIIGKTITGSTPSTSINDYYEDGKRHFVSPADIQTNRFIFETKTNLTELGLKKTRKVKKGSVLFVCIGSTIGKVAQANEECATNQQINAIQCNDSNSNDFLYSLLEKNGKRIKLLAGIQAVPQINKTDFTNLKFKFPTLPEQKKIAKFLTAVDKRIQLLEKKQQAMQQYKKGVMKKLFKYLIRLSDSKLRNGKLKDFGSFYYGKGAPKSSIIEGGATPCVRYGELYSTYSEMIKEIKSYTTVDPKDLKFSKGGEVLVPRVGEDPLDFANCSFLPFSGVAIGEMISVYTTSENGLFLTYYINSELKKELAKKVEGGNVSNLYFKYVEDIDITIPSLTEQKKIADFLSAIDIKINLVEQQIEKSKVFKKGLLQQMFV